MKTYCKPAKVDVENTEFNIPAVRKAFDGKYKRRDFQRLLLNTGLVTEQELALTFIETVSAFAKQHHAGLTVMPGGEHWFHTEEQMQFLDHWIRECNAKHVCC